MLEYCYSEGIHHFCYGTLSGGLTAKRFLDIDSLEPETRSQVKYLQVIEDTLGFEGYQGLLRLLDNIAQKHRVEIPHIAVQYILQQTGVAAAIIGVRNSKHATSNSRIFDFVLSNEDVESIREFLSQYPILDGQPFELERTVGSKFRSIMKMNLNDK